jgi:hypothetical protein
VGKSPGEICDKMFKETGIDLRSLGYGYDALAYWSMEMLLPLVTLIFHELHPKYVQIAFLSESDFGKDMVCRSIETETKFILVVMKIQVAVNKNTTLEHFCLYLIDLKDAVCHILDPDQDAEMKTHKKVNISMKYTWFMQYMANRVVAAITRGSSEI